MLKLLTILLISALTQQQSSSSDVKDNYYEVFKRASTNLKISSKCRNQLDQLMKGIEQNEKWALTVLEANGEIPLKDEEEEKEKLNPFDSCITTNHTIGIESILGKYCVPAKEFKSHRDWKRIQLATGVCIPNNCSVSDIIQTYNRTETPFWTTEILCQTKETEPYDNVMLISITIFGIFSSIILASTLYDISVNYQKQDSPHLLFTAFSLITNVKKLLQMNGSKQPGQISCLNGLRVISLFSIIIFHAFIIKIQFIKNTEYYRQWNSSMYGYMVIGNGLCVNTFLVMTGLLISFNEMKAISRKENFNIFGHYINRYVRVSSVYFLVVLMSLSLIYLGSGPLWKAYSYHYRSNCCTYWWSTLLYLQTIVNVDRICLGTSWYLSLDMQLFLISPILLIPLKTRPKLVLWLAAVLAFLSSISIFGISWYYGGISAKTYHGTICMNTLNRASPWFFGFILGYFLFTSSKSAPKLRMIWIVLLSVASVITYALCVYINILDKFGEEYDLENSIKVTFLHPLWSSFVCWVIYACVSGQMNLVNRFLSLPVFELLAKISYSAYIIHFTVMYHIAYMSRRPIIFKGLEIVVESLWYTMITIAISVIATLTIEMPVVTITKFFLRK